METRSNHRKPLRCSKWTTPPHWRKIRSNALLDAYFSKAAAFETAKKAKAMIGSHEKHIVIVTRGKSNMVAYERPTPARQKSAADQKKYGDKVILKDLFSDDTRFTGTTLRLYGQETKVRYLCVDLLWKPVKKLLRFILVQSNRGSLILWCPTISRFRPRTASLPMLADIKSNSDSANRKMISDVFLIIFGAMRCPNGKDGKIPVASRRRRITRALRPQSAP